MLKRPHVLPIVIILGLFAACACAQQEPATDVAATDTTVILVRHAEKVRTNPHDNDPRLTDEGHARAQSLVHVLGDAGIDIVYSTPYRRTRDTAKPLAKHLGLELEKAPVGNHAEGMARRIRERHSGQTVLVVGHSNTTPEVARELGIESPPIIEDHVFDELWVIRIPAVEGSEPSMLRLKFGEPSPDATPPIADLGGTDEESDEAREPNLAA